MNNSQLHYKAKTFDQNPKAALFFEVAEALQTLQEVKKLFSQVQLIENIKGPQGEPGADGAPGLSPTRDELLRLIVPLIHIPEDGKTPTTKELTTLIKPIVTDAIVSASLITENDAIELIETYIPLLIPDTQAVEITPLEIANKINTLEGMIKLSALEKFPTIDDFLKELNDPKSKKKIRSQVIDMNDLRWHGGGLSTVAHDNTLTGNGTTASPLSVVGGGGGFTGSQEKSTTTPDGVVTTFSFAHTPLVIFWNGQFQTLTDDYTVLGLTITFTASAGIPSTDAKIVNLYA